jgi:hypothetical protein
MQTLEAPKNIFFKSGVSGIHTPIEPRQSSRIKRRKISVKRDF